MIKTRKEKPYKEILNAQIELASQGSYQTVPID